MCVTEPVDCKTSETFQEKQRLISPSTPGSMFSLATQVVRASVVTKKPDIKTPLNSSSFCSTFLSGQQKSCEIPQHNFLGAL